jgi:von Willebrand factor type A domain
MVRLAAKSTKRGMGMGLWALLGALGVFSTSCGGVEESLISPCESELQCGQPCTPSSPCGSGRYCGAQNTCTAECILGDSRCGAGNVCSSGGRCVPDMSLTPPGGGGGLGAASGVCADAKITLDKQVPTVVLLVDQSSSMDARFADSDRWQVLRTALMTPGSGVVSTLQSEVRFGLTLYSGRNGMAPCPALTSVAPAIDNFAAIDAAYPVPTSAIIDDTPTGESIDAARDALLGVTEPGPKVIVLATDGEPDTCEFFDSNPEQGRAVALQAARDAFQAGVFTFYISVGNDISEQHATQMANVGQGYQENDRMQRFYRANDQGELASAFQTIVNGVRSCSFALNGMVKEGAENQGTVLLDGRVLPLDDPDGWRLSSPTTIELRGAACAAVKDDQRHELSASFTCGSIVPVEVPK